MITANIIFKDGATRTRVFNSLTEALEKIKLELDVGDYFTIWEDNYGSFR
jgi:hypothetical protein